MMKKPIIHPYNKSYFPKRERERERNMAISPPHMYLACTYFPPVLRVVPTLSGVGLTATYLII
jgi:hypothetical protein